MSSRIQLTFSRRQAESVRAMAAELGVTKGEVVRRAFALLTVAVRETESGNRISVTKDGAIVKDIVGIGFEKAVTS